MFTSSLETYYENSSKVPCLLANYLHVCKALYTYSYKPLPLVLSHSHSAETLIIIRPFHVYLCPTLNGPYLIIAARASRGKIKLKRRHLQMLEHLVDYDEALTMRNTQSPEHEMNRTKILNVLKHIYYSRYNVTLYQPMKSSSFWQNKHTQTKTHL